MAEREGDGARTLWRGVLAAALVLALLVLGVRTMVGRMTHAHVDEVHQRAAEQRAESARGDTGDSPAASPPASTAPPRAGSGSTRPPPPSAAPPPSTGPGGASADPSGPAADDPTGTGSGSGAEAPPVHHGTLDAVEIRGVIRQALPEIRFCFEWQLEAHPDLAGRVTMEFTIQEDGTVTNAGVLEDALHDDVVTNCFTHVMGGLRFPPPEGGPVLVHYPFALANSPEARRPEGI